MTQSRREEEGGVVVEGGLASGRGGARKAGGGLEVHLGRTPREGQSRGSRGDGRRGWAFEGGTVDRIYGKVEGGGGY